MIDVLIMFPMLIMLIVCVFAGRKSGKCPRQFIVVSVCHANFLGRPAYLTWILTLEPIKFLSRTISRLPLPEPWRL
jgi:hypothetical protein